MVTAESNGPEGLPTDLTGAISGQVGWQVSAFCSNGTCVEVAHGDPGIYAIRDSKQRYLGEQQPTLTFDGATFEAFLRRATTDSSPATSDDVAIDHLADGCVAFRSLTTDVVLTFDAEEFSDFVDGVRAGEFRPVLTSA